MHQPASISASSVNPEVYTMDSKIRQNQQQVGDLTNIMRDNMKKVLQRGNDLENLQQKSNDLEKQAGDFSATSKRIRRWACIKNAKWTAILIIVVIVIIIAISIGLGVGLNKKKN